MCFASALAVLTFQKENKSRLPVHKCAFARVAPLLAVGEAALRAITTITTIVRTGLITSRPPSSRPCLPQLS